MPFSYAAPGNFVPLAESGGRNRLYFMSYKCGLSVESVNLKFEDSVERSVYGKIYINTHVYTVCAVYDRSSDKADTISSPSGADLSICGPRYFVEADAPTAIYVDLYEVGSEKPFFYKRVPLRLSTITPNQTVSVRQSVVMACGGMASLTITMTSIRPCASTNIFVSILYPESYKEWLVSGSLTAVQTLPGGIVKRRVRLFNRSEDEPMSPRLLHPSPNPFPGKHRALLDIDRDVFLAPIWYERSFFQDRNKTLREAKCPETGIDPNFHFGNGLGSYTTVEFDLKLVDSVGEGKYCHVKESLHYQFKGSHFDGCLFRATLKGGIFTMTPTDGLIRDLDEIQVLVVVQPTTDPLGMQKEPQESEMPLFPLPAKPTADQMESSEDDDESESEDELPDLMNEGSIKPATDLMDGESIKPTITDPMEEGCNEEILTSADPMDGESSKEILTTLDPMDGESHKRRIMSCTSKEILPTTELMAESNKRRIMSCTSKEILPNTGESNKPLPIAADRMTKPTPSKDLKEGESNPLQTTDMMDAEGDNPVLSPEFKDDDLMEREP